jgi:hypothetical protein
MFAFQKLDPIMLWLIDNMYSLVIQQLHFISVPFDRWLDQASFSLPAPSGQIGPAKNLCPLVFWTNFAGSYRIIENILTDTDLMNSIRKLINSIGHLRSSFAPATILAVTTPSLP